MQHRATDPTPLAAASKAVVDAAAQATPEQRIAALEQQVLRMSVALASLAQHVTELTRWVKAQSDDRSRIVLPQ